MKEEYYTRGDGKSVMIVKNVKYVYVDPGDLLVLKHLGTIKATVVDNLINTTYIEIKSDESEWSMSYGASERYFAYHESPHKRAKIPLTARSWLTWKWWSMKEEYYTRWDGKRMMIVQDVKYIDVSPGTLLILKHQDSIEVDIADISETTTRLEIKSKDQ